LDVEKFNECLESRKYKAEVEKDFNDGLKAGVYGTPTFFINGRVIIGPKPLRAFEKIIDEELEK
jgi:protein-disulfide isomerase